MCIVGNCKEVEKMLGWVTWGAASDSIPPDYLAKAREAFEGICAVERSLSETRAAFVALGEMIRKRPGAERAMKDLGRVIETLSMATSVIERR